MVGVCLFLAACKKSPAPTTLSPDEKMSQLIVGSWATPGKGVIEIDADGTSTTIISNKTGEMLFYQSDWKITNGYCNFTIEDVVSRNTNHEAVGAVDRMKIISLDVTNLVWELPVRFESNNVELLESEKISLRRLK